MKAAKKYFLWCGFSCNTLDGSNFLDWDHSNDTC